MNADPVLVKCYLQFIIALESGFQSFLSHFNVSLVFLFDGSMGAGPQAFGVAHLVLLSSVWVGCYVATFTKHIKTRAGFVRWDWVAYLVFVVIF